MRGLVGISCIIFLLQVHILSIEAQHSSAAHGTYHGVEHNEHQEFEYDLLDRHLASVLQLLWDQGTAQHNARNNTVLGSKELHDAIRKLDSVANLLTARRSLGVGYVYDLQEPVAATLVTVLSRRVPNKAQEAVRLLKKIQGGVHTLLVSGGHEPNSSGSTTGDGSSSAAAGASGHSADLILRHSFPLLRRVAVARLLQLWLLHLRQYATTDASGFPVDSGSGTSKTPIWAAEARRDLARTLMMLFRVHRGGMRSRSAIEFLHISKAAGTSMCHLAEVSGCRAQDFSMGRTCLMRDFDDQPRWINGTHHWRVIAPLAEPWGAHPYAFLMYGVPRMPHRKRTCSARLANLNDHRWNFFANEYTIYNELTWYTEPTTDDTDARGGGRSRARGDVAAAPLPPVHPPAPPAAPAPPLSVMFEETAAEYGTYVSQLAAMTTSRSLISDTAAGTDPAGGGSRVGSSSSSAVSSRSSEDGWRRRRRLSSRRSSNGRTGDSSSSSSGAVGDGSSSDEGGSSSRVSPILEGAHVCPHFANVAVLRDPAERFSSHVTFIAQTYAAKYKWPGIGAAFAPGRTSAAWWRAFVPPLFDNYMVRSLGGEAVFAMAAEALEAGAAEYVQLARVMLAQYDVILVLEEEEHGHRRTSHFGLGWQHLLTEFQLRNASSLITKLDVTVSAQLEKLLPEPQLLEELKQAAVRYDSMLYEYGKLLSSLDDVVWRVAAEGLGEPLPGFHRGAVPPCGYLGLNGPTPLSSPSSSPPQPSSPS